jgi:hypothetical protein
MQPGQDAEREDQLEAPGAMGEVVHVGDGDSNISEAGLGDPVDARATMSALESELCTA